MRSSFVDSPSASQSFDGEYGVGSSQAQASKQLVDEVWRIISLSTCWNGLVVRGKTEGDGMDDEKKMSFWVPSAFVDVLDSSAVNKYGHAFDEFLHVLQDEHNFSCENLAIWLVHRWRLLQLEEWGRAILRKPPQTVVTQVTRTVAVRMSHCSEIERACIRTRNIFRSLPRGNSWKPMEVTSPNELGLLYCGLSFEEMVSNSWHGVVDIVLYNDRKCYGNSKGKGYRHRKSVRKV